MDTVELVDTAERVQAQPVKQADFVTQAALRQRPHRARTQGCCQAVPVEQAEQRRKRQGEGLRRHTEAVHGAGTATGGGEDAARAWFGSRLLLEKQPKLQEGQAAMQVRAGWPAC